MAAHAKTSSHCKTAVLLVEALTALYKEFGKWADDAMDALELSDKIHEFHNGISRELYSLYTSLDSAILVSRAIALGLIETTAIGKELFAKLEPEIEPNTQGAPMNASPNKRFERTPVSNAPSISFGSNVRQAQRQPP